MKIDDSEETGEETKILALDFGGRRISETDRIGTNGGRSVSSTLRVIRRPFVLIEN